LSEEKKERVALYARVSTTKQDETLQLPRLRKLAELRGFEIYKEYQDEASGKDQFRPSWQNLMADAKEHRFDAIMVVKLDRVMRSVVNLNTVLGQLQVYKVRLITEDMGEINPNNPNGKLLMQFLAAIAEWERETISTRTREALEEKKAAGIRLGRKPRDDLPLREIAQDRINGLSWNAISKARGIAKGTLMSRKEEVERFIESIGGDSE